MPTLRQIADYLKRYKDKYPMEVLKAHLLDQGVTEAMIEEAVGAATGQMEADPPPSPFSAPPRPDERIGSPSRTRERSDPLGVRKKRRKRSRGLAPSSRVARVFPSYRLLAGKSEGGVSPRWRASTQRVT